MVLRNTVLKYVGAVSFGLSSLIALGTILGLGIKGIVEAERLNLCDRSNVTNDCVFQTTLTTVENDPEPTSLVGPDLSNELDWIYWLIGSSVASLLWTVLTSLALVFVIDILHDKQVDDLEKLKTKHKKSDAEGGKQRHEEIEMKEREGTGATGVGDPGTEDAGIRKSPPSGEDEPDETKVTSKDETKKKLVEAGIKKKHLGDDETDHSELMVDYIGAYRVKEWHGKPLRYLGVGGYFLLLIALLTFILSLICLLWAIALGYYHTNRLDKQLADFALVELLVGFILPVLLFISVVLLGVLVEHVTIGRVDTRKRINRFIPSVVFEEGVDNDYWVIEDRFYFKLDKRNEHLKHSVFYSCNKELSTWLLTAIVALSLLLCFSYFVDITVIEEQTQSSCPDDAGAYDCFNGTSFNFVDCRDENQIDTNLITSFAQAFAFYLATVAIFGRTFSIVKTLLHLHRTRMWGVLFIVVGGVAVIIAIIFLIIEDRFQIQVDVLSVLQVGMACLFIILVGVLILKGDWYEKIFDHKKIKPLAQLLLHYDSISTAEVHQIEHSYVEEIKKEDPTSVHVVETVP